MANTQKKMCGNASEEQGGVLILIAFMLMMFCAFVALAVDVGYLYVAKGELQNVADAAALAGARQLGVAYEGLTLAEQQLFVADQAAIAAAVSDVSGRNTAAGVSISNVPGSDIVIGTWDSDTKTITPTLNRPNAVRVTARRDSQANTPVGTFFAKALGISSADVSATATAALTGVTSIGEGELIPVSISSAWFESKPQFCGQPIKMYPANEETGCAGWNTFRIDPSSVPNLSSILQNMLNCAQAQPCDSLYLPPAVNTGDPLSYTGGNVANILKSNPSQESIFSQLFNYMKVHDTDGDPNTWTVALVVYEPDPSKPCGNPVQTLPTDGFAMAKITGITETPLEINAEVVCNYVKPSRGGGGDYGLLGSIPGLVQ